MDNRLLGNCNGPGTNYVRWRTHLRRSVRTFRLDPGHIMNALLKVSPRFRPYPPLVLGGFEEYEKIPFQTSLYKYMGICTCTHPYNISKVRTVYFRGLRYIIFTLNAPKPSQRSPVKKNSTLS